MTNPNEKSLVCVQNFSLSHEPSVILNLAMPRIEESQKDFHRMRWKSTMTMVQSSITNGINYTTNKATNLGYN